MLVNVIGNAYQTDLVPPPANKQPVVREKVFGLPVDRDILFTDDRNVYQPSVEKRQRRWIVKLAFLKSFLLRGERLLRITAARSPCCWYEQLFTAGFFLGIERAFLVFTSFRILHIPTDSAYRYRQSIAQIRYQDIRRIRMRARSLVIDYKNGRQERFGGIVLRERRKIRQILPALPLEKAVRQEVGRRHLCPRCKVVLSERLRRCRRCDLAFKSKKMAAVMTFLFPGGGYFYTRQYYPAAVFFTLEVLLMALLTAAGASLIPLGGDRGLALAGIALLLAALKAAAWLHGAHFLQQYIPRKTRLGRWPPPAEGTSMNK